MTGNWQGVPLILVLASTFSFLFGSVPFAQLIARIFKLKALPLLESGEVSNEIFSRFSDYWPSVIIVVLFEMGKGMVPVFLVGNPSVLQWASQFSGLSLEYNSFVVWASGLFTVLGHCYSPWLGFNGGKGVLPGFGAVLVLSPISAFLGVLAFLLAFVNSRSVSLSSLAGLICGSLTYLVYYPIRSFAVLGAAMVFIILIRHEGSIDSLLEGRESSLKPKDKASY